MHLASLCITPILHSMTKFTRDAIRKLDQGGAFLGEIDAKVSLCLFRRFIIQRGHEHNCRRNWSDERLRRASTLHLILFKVCYKCIVQMIP